MFCRRQIVKRKYIKSGIEENSEDKKHGNKIESERERTRWSG